MSDYSVTLSTTEPNNYVGLIKLRQGDIASQSIQATITANGQLFSFDRLAVFFNAVLPNGNVIRDKVTEVDYVNSKLNYVVADSFLQEVAQVTAWFSFENDEKIIDSTKNFQYSVIGGWKECIPQGNYIYELSEIQREIEEIIGNKNFTSLISKIDSIKTEYNYINQVKADKTELNKANEEILKLEATTSTLDNKVSALSSGAPKAVSRVSDMTDKTKNYVYTGTELGYTPGNWYYWSGTAWISGGVYQSTGIGDHSISRAKLNFLSLPGVIGKNLFDPLATTLGYYIAHASGKMLPIAEYSASDFISVLPSTAYQISGTNEQLAFYDSNKVYISGLSFANEFKTTPANAAFIRMSLKTTQINDVQLELGTTTTSYEPYAIYFNNESIHSPIPESKLDPSLIKGTASKNLFNKSRATPGYYISYYNGKMFPIAEYSASDFISVLPSTAYQISGTNEQLAFYDSNKVYISGLRTANEFKTTPANAAFIRMSLKTTQINDVQLELGTTTTSYEPYGYYIDNSTLSSRNIEYIKERIGGSIPIVVKKDSTGDFSSLVEAVNSIKDSSQSKTYDIYIYDDHDIIEELGGQSFVESLTDNSDRAGFTLPGFVNLHGQGMITLSGKIDKTWNVGYNAIKALSLMEVEIGMNSIENITFEVQNMRYAVHDESNGSRPNTVVNWKNCKFIHHGNADFASDRSGYWGSVTAYGMGTASNNYRSWENCIFDSAAFYAFGCHDNKDFAFPAILKFDNCEFYNRKEHSDDSQDLQDIRLSTYSTGSVANLAIINNSILKGILIKNETIGTENRWRVKGGGNSNRSISEANTSVPKTITI
ncbi:BppU family phage baseplate upper protein [Lactococcus lactis]|uniref:BppU family phage baseplate upper protein n=1 Tax=Lactococcus lactis TaxID=1358 RepID=UPI0013CD3B72|nr:BppU family phage baseplate upper protein [Lactococcus lactis]NEX53645.1 BppU family phage baseplate upper protein [Lactococcus lactis]